MPNGHGQRQEDEEELIAAVEQEGWDHYEDPPDWVVDAAESDEIPTKGGEKTYYGDNYVYLAVPSVHGVHVHIFSQKKSEYFETTPAEGTCPNCQKHIKRYDDDEHLTCHRCGWEYTPPTAELLKETTSEEGWCPNCERYIRKYEEDEYLTCHRCGWQHKPLSSSIKDTIQSLF